MNLMDFIELGKWKDRDNWLCQLCPYATTEGLAKMLAHVGSAHKVELSERFELSEQLLFEEEE